MSSWPDQALLNQYSTHGNILICEYLLIFIIVVIGTTKAVNLKIESLKSQNYSLVKSSEQAVIVEKQN